MISAGNGSKKRGRHHNSDTNNLHDGRPCRAAPAGSATGAAPSQPGTDLLLMHAARAGPEGVAGALELFCWQEAAIWHADQGKVAQTANLTGFVN